MYAEGDGVTQDDLKAFQYFRGIADSHAEDNPDTPQSRFVANAFVALGHYYLDGIPKTAIKRDPDRAREMFAYAASYFHDSEAQYYLARLYLNGAGAPHDPRPRRAGSAFRRRKGNASRGDAGAMLFPATTCRARPRAAEWLTLAKDSAKDGAATDQAWITGSTTAPSSRRPKTSARWRWSISSAGWKRGASRQSHSGYDLAWLCRMPGEVGEQQLVDPVCGLVGHEMTHTGQNFEPIGT